ncbi:hypothetical protein ACVWYO_000525 [Sphingomonas sp. UYP23]
MTGDHHAQIRQAIAPHGGQHVEPGQSGHVQIEQRDPRV